MRAVLPSKVAVPLHLAFIVAYLASVRIAPGEVMAYLPVVWLVVGLIVIALLFPAAHRGEDVEGARMRSFLSFRRDYAILWGVAGVAFILIQTLCGPRVLQLNPKNLVWEFSQARIRDFPSCFDQLLSLDGAFCALLAFSAMFVIRKCLGRNGRTLLLQSIAVIASVLSLYGLIRYATASVENPVVGFATFSRSVEAGLFFTMVFSVCCGLLTTELGQKHLQKKKARLLFVTAVLTYFGAVFSLSALALVLATAVLILNLVYGFLFLRQRTLAERKMRLFAIAIVVLAITAFLHFIAYPENRIHGQIDKVFHGPWTTEAQKAETATLRAVAWRTFADNHFAGVGTWGYSEPASFARYVENDAEWLSLGDQNERHYFCENDFLQCLAEYGTIGCILLGVPFVLLIIGIVRRLISAATKAGCQIPRSEDGDEDFFDRYSPLVFSLFLATVTAGVVSFCFSIFHQPLVFLTWTIFLAMLFCFLPKPVQHEKTPLMARLAIARSSFHSHRHHRENAKAGD